MAFYYLGSSAGELLQVKAAVVGTIPDRLTDGLHTPGIGEERWGLSVVQLLLERGIRVYALPGKGQWCSSEPIPDNFLIGHVPSEPYDYFGYHVDGGLPEGADHYWLCRFDDFGRPYVAREKETVVHPYPHGSRFDALARQVRASAFRYLPYVPQCSRVFTDRVGYKKIFWTAKNGFSPFSQSTVLTRELVAAIESALSADPTMTFDMVSTTHGASEEDAYQAIVNHSLYRTHLARFGERVTIHRTLSYTAFLALLEQSKLICNPGNFNHTYGGASVEAALIGIPSVQYRQGPFSGCGDAMLIDSSGAHHQFVSMFWSLLSDTDCYSRSAQRYHNYASAEYSSDTFWRCLEG